MSDKYILGPDGRTPQRADLMEWARWYETSGEERRVARTEIGDATISTVFLGLDHQFGDGPPFIFETLVMGDGPHAEHMEQCSTWAEAEAQHARVVEMVTSAPMADPDETLPCDTEPAGDMPERIWAHDEGTWDLDAFDGSEYVRADLLAAAIRERDEAVAAERERCARIADEHHCHRPELCDCALAIAAAIRGDSK